MVIYDNALVSRHKNVDICKVSLSSSLQFLYRYLATKFLRCRRSFRKPPQSHDNRHIAYSHDSHLAIGYAPINQSDEGNLLRCKRCHGSRSYSYHRNHHRDSINYPSTGICSRRRTGCAAAKERSHGFLNLRKNITPIHELPAY